MPRGRNSNIGSRTFVGSDGRKKAAVTREELAASGLSLREYLNKQNRERKASGMASGGKVKNTPKRSKVPKGGAKNNYCKGGVVSRGQGKAKRGIRATKLR